MSSACVVVLTHNRPRLLLQALASVWAQTSLPAEIVIADNGSRPPVSAASLSGGSASPIPVILNLANAGPSAGRNAGAQVTQADWLLFLDDDDCWAPAYVERVLAHVEASGADAVLTWMSCFDAHGQWPGKHIPSHLHRLDLHARNHGVVGSNIAVRRALFEEIGGFDEKLTASEDKDLLLRLLSHGARVEVLQEELVRYRVHEAERISDPRRYSPLLAAGKRQFYLKHRQSMRRRTRRRLRAEAAYLRFRTEVAPVARYAGLLVAFVLRPMETLSRLRRDRQRGYGFGASVRPVPIGPGGASDHCEGQPR